ncbi:class I SAM-dependent methyltransferase [Phototrophicus methaneseepsis]|uniref:Class I SAM-dependent methyltransferase n=1 Tax=Phototrophicus methaneseepsis TaxID=2710758 RepID=A0A7S8E761_9CHLR|nr:class I SAM-dependent methyltransferase [Phototrophicus methaneseepsis]QPC81602.1 class I SAM-dependent methyltransferase [Phototrophicus methaneseepsis]
MTESVNFDRASDFYDATRAFPDSVIEKIGPFLSECADFKGDEVVLEVGIGTGRIALPLAPHVSHIYGADISAGMLKKLLQKRGDAAVYPAMSDAHDLPYPSHSFDACVVTHVFHLVANPQRVLAEIGRTLKSDGLLLHTFTKHSKDPDMEVINEAWRSHSVPTERPVSWANVTDMFPQEGWEKVGEYKLNYEYETCPQEYLDRVAKRQWSSTWHMSDDELAAGVAAINAAIDTHFGGDANYKVTTNEAYQVHVYKPPRP